MAPVLFAWIMLDLEPDSWRYFHFYNSLLDSALNISSYTYGTASVIWISFFVVRPLLRMTIREFEKATEKTNTVKLEVSGETGATPPPVPSCIEIR